MLLLRLPLSLPSPAISPTPPAKLDFTGCSDGKESACNAGDPGSIPGSGKIPWRREWQPSPVFLPGEFHRWRSLESYSPWGQTWLNDWHRQSLLWPGRHLARLLSCSPAPYSDPSRTGWGMDDHNFGDRRGMGNKTFLFNCCCYKLASYSFNRKDF